jgi:ABC-2 type transport system ATP-binding protein
MTDVDTVPAVETRELSKTYDGANKPSLSAVSLSLAAGRCAGLIGPNGAGKTTTMLLLAGALRPSAGSIQMFGEPFGPDTVALKRRIGYVPADDILFEHLSAEEQVIVSGLACGLDAVTAAARGAELFAMLDLHADARRRIREYSHGMKKKVAVASALVHDPDLLLLDEPLEGIDVLTARLLKQLFRLMIDRGKTLLLTSHNLALIDDLCDRVAVVDGGALVYDGSIEALKARADAASADPLEDGLVALLGRGAEPEPLSWLAKETER